MYPQCVVSPTPTPTSGTWPPRPVALSYVSLILTRSHCVLDTTGTNVTRPAQICFKGPPTTTLFPSQQAHRLLGLGRPASPQFVKVVVHEIRLGGCWWHAAAVPANQVLVRGIDFHSRQIITLPPNKAGTIGNIEQCLRNMAGRLTDCS